MADQFSTYPLQELLQRWKRDELTAEQLAGHLLQHIILHERRILQLEKMCGRPQDGEPPAGNASAD